MNKGKECKSCGEEFTRGNSFHSLCYKCNEGRLKLKRGVKGVTTPKSKKEPLKVFKIIKKVDKIRSGEVQGKHEIVNPLQVGSESELFLEVWNSRPHICQHCGKPLGDEMKAHFFSHIYPKSIRPWLRLDPDNIELLCMECHHEHDFGKRKKEL